jgi:hypothetical protein
MTTTEKCVEKISKRNLIELLMGVNKSTFVNVTMKTPVRMNKTGNPFYDRIEKISSTNFLLGNSYEDRVRSNQEKEHLNGNFVSEQPKGKLHVSKCVLVDEKTKTVFYVMLERFDEIKPQNIYIVDGNDPIEKVLFEEWMIKSYDSQKQKQERKVMVITVKIENIIGITLDGVRYEIQ